MGYRERIISFILPLLAGLTVVLFSPSFAEIDPRYEDRVRALVDRLKASGFADEELQRLFSDGRVELYPQILERRAKGLNYFGKEFGLLTNRSVERGQRILQDKADILSRMEQTYGVDREVVVAILRVETNFSAYMGKHPVFNSLLTLAVIENRRSLWAEGELAELLRIAKRSGKDPLTIKGSWAGAFGMAQFIPSSYTKFAVDGNGDGAIDLFDFSDAAASIANYLSAYGWERGQPEKQWKAVYGYNHCDEYVKAVFAYAKALKTERNELSPITPLSGTGQTLPSPHGAREPGYTAP